MPTPQVTPGPGRGRGLERAIALGMDLVRQAREAQRSVVLMPTREQRMAAQHQAAQLRHEAALREHRGRIAAARTGMIAATGGSAMVGFAALQAGMAGGADTILLGALTAGGAALGWRQHRRVAELTAHPPVPELPPLPPARLRPGARGHDQAERVANALMHLYDLVPNVARLYPQAGQELWRAVSEVEPLLRGQVDRLASLDRIAREMVGSHPAVAAADAAEVVRGRLSAGADALEELIAAAARMLAAPDLVEGVPDTLAPAILSLEAFAHGLHQASQVSRPGLPRYPPA